MTLADATEVMPLHKDNNGVIYIGETRVTLETVIAAFTEGATAEEIGQEYPSLALADIYHVIGYYLRHTAEVEAYLLLRQAQATQVRAENETRFDPQGIRARLLARRQA